LLASPFDFLYPAPFSRCLSLPFVLRAVAWQAGLFYTFNSIPPSSAFVSIPFNNWQLHCGGGIVLLEASHVIRIELSGFELPGSFLPEASFHECTNVQLTD